MASLLEWRLRILLLAEFQEGLPIDLSILRSSHSEQADFTCGLEFIDDSRRSRGVW